MKFHGKGLCDHFRRQGFSRRQVDIFLVEITKCRIPSRDTCGGSLFDVEIALWRTSTKSTRRHQEGQGVRIALKTLNPTRNPGVPCSPRATISGKRKTARNFPRQAPSQSRVLVTSHPKCFQQPFAQHIPGPRTSELPLLFR